MIKLIIKTPGMYVNIPGISPFRTPAEIDITKLNRNLVEAELKKNGIGNYKIMEFENSVVIRTIKKIGKILKIKDKDDNNIDKKEIINILEKQQKIINNQEKTTIKIYKLLENFISSSNKNEDIKVILKQDKNKKFIEEDEEDEGFIPTINLDDTKSIGKIPSQKVTANIDLKIVEELNKMKK